MFEHFIPRIVSGGTSFFKVQINSLQECFLRDGEDLAELVLGLKEDLFELGRNILVEVLEEMD